MKRAKLDKPLFCTLSGSSPCLPKTVKNFRNSRGSKVTEGFVDLVY